VRFRFWGIFFIGRFNVESVQSGSQRGRPNPTRGTELATSGGCLIRQRKKSHRVPRPERFLERGHELRQFFCSQRPKPQKSERPINVHHFFLHGCSRRIKSLLFLRNRILCLSTLGPVAPSKQRVPRSSRGGRATLRLLYCPVTAVSATALSGPGFRWRIRRASRNRRVRVPSSGGA
jgi:hypothetical protein